MALRPKVVDFVWLQIVEQLYQRHGVHQVSIVQKQSRARQMMIFVNVINAIRVERGGTANDSVNLVTLFQ